MCKLGMCIVMMSIVSSRGQSPGRAIVLPPVSELASASAWALAAASALAKSLMLKFFYVMGKALSNELSCPCDRSYSSSSLHSRQTQHTLTSLKENTTCIFVIKFVRLVQFSVHINIYSSPPLISSKILHSHKPGFCSKD